MTNQTSCTHYTGLTGVGNQFDRFADLNSNNTFNKKHMLIHTSRYIPSL
jgi:hypothetical protein